MYLTIPIMPKSWWMRAPTLTTLPFVSTMKHLLKPSRTRTWVVARKFLRWEKASWYNIGQYYSCNKAWSRAIVEKLDTSLCACVARPKNIWITWTLVGVGSWTTYHNSARSRKKVPSLTKKIPKNLIQTIAKVHLELLAKVGVWEEVEKQL